MATVNVTWTTVATSFPAGTVASGYRVSLAGPTTAVQDVPLTARLATFLDVAGGDYTVTVQLLDGAGNPLGAVASASFVVPAGVMLDQPSTVSVEVTA